MSVFKKILLSSLGALLYQSSDIKAEPRVYLNDDQTTFDKVKFFSPINDLSLKFRLKLNSSGEMSFDAHRSHRSHSSHRSHYSSQGGHYSHFSSSSGNTSGSGSKSSTSGSSSSGSSSGSSNAKIPIQSAVKSYSLGARTLYRGMKGTDVTELVNILVRKKYLQFEDGTTTAYGAYDYDETIYNAVKQFQKDRGITADGIVGSTTVYYLKN
jgi:hypothetical protein